MRKRLSILAAIALLGASTAGAAQSVRPSVAPEPAQESVSTAEGSALNSSTSVGVIFGLIAFVILVWLLGNGDDLEAPISP